MKSRAHQFHVALSALTVIAVVLGVLGLARDSAALFGGALLVVGTATVATALWVNITLRKLVRSLNRSIDQRAYRTESRLIEMLADSRRKQSRHEYRHGLALDRIERLTTEVRGAAEGALWHLNPGSPPVLEFKGAGPHAPHALLVSSNGGGVGHLTRLLSVARHAQLDANVSILTLSTAHEAVAGLGWPVHYYPSKESSGKTHEKWNYEFARFFDGVLRTNRVDGVLFDGTWLYRGVHESCRRQGVPLIWSCRGLWRDGTDQQQLHHWKALATELVVPGEAAQVHEDSIEAEEFQQTPPVTLFSRPEILGQDEALLALGLSPQSKYVLIQVGGGNRTTTSDIRDVAVQAVSALGEEWVAVVARSPLSAEGTASDRRVITLDRYPVADNLKAFEFAITGAGYNTVHEGIVAELPMVLLPSDRTLTDDQQRRAKLLAAGGYCYVANGEEELAHAVAQLGDSVTRARFRSALKTMDFENGSQVVAEILYSHLQAGAAR